MKKVWIVVLVLIIVAAIVGLWLLIKPVYEQKIFDRISYRSRQYRLGLTPAMNAQELQVNKFGDVQPTGKFIHGREIYDSSIGFQYVPTVIFLKQKNSELFDIYSLVGGP